MPTCSSNAPSSNSRCSSSKQSIPCTTSRRPGSPCRWGEYANGLSWNQHLQIRKFARQEFKKNGSYDYLERARLRLHEHWQESVSWKTRADQKQAARYSGATSARVLGGGAVEVGKVGVPPVEPICTEQIKKYPPINPDDFEVVDF